MIAANETFDGTWPYVPRFFIGNGFRQHFVDEGPRDTEETFVCVHGEPMWAYLYRHFISALSELGRVVVPDHMGFGKSETPQDRSYSIREHSENLEALLLDLDLRDVTLVMQDWGGPIGSHFAYTHPDRVKRLVVMNTMVGGQPPEGAPSLIEYPWFQWVQSDAFEPTITNLSATALSVTILPGVGHFIQEDAPEIATSLISQFVQMT